MDRKTLMHGLLQWSKSLLLALAFILAGAVVSVIPPFKSWFDLVDAHQASWLMVAGGAAGLGFALMMAGILDLLMAQDRTWSHEGAEDVERSAHVGARPWRAASYRGWGHARGSEQFTLQEVKVAWRTGAWRRETVWRRRYVTMLGALLLTIGVFGAAFAAFPPPVKVLAGGALLYAISMIGWGLWKA